jgi:hypothetical protein
MDLNPLLTDKQRFAVSGFFPINILYSLKLLSSIFVVDSPFSNPLSGGKGNRAYGVFS